MVMKRTKTMKKDRKVDLRDAGFHMSCRLRLSGYTYSHVRQVAAFSFGALMRLNPNCGSLLILGLPRNQHCMAPACLLWRI